MKPIAFYKYTIILLLILFFVACAEASRFALDGQTGALISIVEDASESASLGGNSPGFRIGGTVQGLKSGTVQLKLNDEILPVSANGAFQFNSSVAQNKNYQISVASAAANHSCKVYSDTTENPSGTATANVSNLIVYCTTILINGKVAGDTIEIKEDGTALNVQISLSGPWGPNDPVTHIGLSTNATIDHFSPGPENFDTNFANPDTVSVTASDLTPANVSDFGDKVHTLAVTATPIGLSLSFTMKILDNDRRVREVVRNSGGNLQYGGAAFGVDGADSSCSANAGFTSKALLGVASRVPGSAGWPIKPNTRYYNYDTLNAIATSNGSGLIPYATIYGSTANPANNFWSGFLTNWAVDNTQNCGDWTNNATGTGLSGDGTTGYSCTTAPRLILCIEQ
ncbi:hypothetical protein [Leptospira yasudae]|uniref:hypothetical protein n=1 Tax=Leptospira yasudae TaxID=2202201 RepID=UPI001090E415|nr:hypothetical protein [Leptospira yasudae]TGN01357.1 hypothetical protein EHR10_06915 [Leptospira yasudae]